MVRAKPLALLALLAVAAVGLAVPEVLSGPAAADPYCYVIDPSTGNVTLDPQNCVQGPPPSGP